MGGGIGLSVFHLESLDPSKFRSDFTTLPNGQLPSADEPPSIPYSQLRYAGEPRRGEHEYDVRHFSETQNQPIRVFLNEARTAHEDIRPAAIKRSTGRRLVDLRYGYQEIYTFPIIFDFNLRELRIFHRSDVAQSLAKRLQDSGRVACSRMHFDLDRAKSVPGVEMVYGRWTHRSGPNETHGVFSEDAMREPPSPSETIRILQIAFQDEEKGPLDILLGNDCRIGSRTKGLTVGDILRIYRHFERYLGTTQQVTLDAATARPPTPPSSRQRTLF